MQTNISDRSRIEQAQQCLLGARRYVLELMEYPYLPQSVLGEALSNTEELFWLLELVKYELPADSL